jgi:hypothetical protein
MFVNFRWLIIKDTWIGYLNLKTGLVDQVFLIDQGFKVSNGIETTGIKNGLLIENLSRYVCFVYFPFSVFKIYKIKLISLKFSLERYF